MALQFRPATIEDNDAIFDMMVRVIRETIDQAYQSETIVHVTTNLRYWRRWPESCVHLVATDGLAIVGVVLVRNFWNFCSLFVTDSHRGTGLGKQLTQQVLDACRHRSAIGALYLVSTPSAVAFYQAQGFIPRESRQKLPPGFLPMGYTFTKK